MKGLRPWLGAMSMAPARALLLLLLLAVTILPLPAAVAAGPANVVEAQLAHRAVATLADFRQTDPVSLSRDVMTEISRVPGRVCVDFRDRDGAGYDALLCYAHGPSGWTLSLERITVCVLGG